jgi:hypothetical protein
MILHRWLRRVCAYTRATSCGGRFHCSRNGWSFCRRPWRYCAQVGGWSRCWCRRWSFATLRRRPLHRRVRGLRLQTAIGRRHSSRCLESFSRCCSWVRSGSSCISCEGLPEHALRLLRRWFYRLYCTVLPRYDASGAAHWAGVATPWLIVFAEELDKVRWEQPNHAPVALQSSHPP